MINDAPSLREVSRQFWALLNPLVADTKVASGFANVDRHSGLEAWRQLAEPINEDKELVLKDLLPRVTNPKSATSIDKVEDAVRDWDTDIRLFKKAGGQEPPDEQKRITLVRMLPMEIAAHVSLHWELAEYNAFKKLRDFTFKYVKVLRNLRRATARPTNMIAEREPEAPESASEAGGDSEYQVMMDRLLDT